MRFSIITDEISQDLEHALHVCRDLGVNTVELRMIDGKNIVFHDESSVRQIQSTLAREGMRVCAIGSPFLKCHFWGKHPYAPANRGSVTGFDSREKQWEILERSFELARLFDTSLVRTFSFWRLPSDPTIRDEMLSILAAAVERTEQAGLKLILENEYECIIGTGAETGWYLERLPSEAFGVIWDPGNEAMLDSQPFPEGYHHVKGRVAHVHLKDMGEQHRWVKFGSGVIDYVGQFRALAQDGYQGFLSLETHYCHPGGGLERATRESFAALQTICQQAGIDIE